MAFIPQFWFYQIIPLSSIYISPYRDVWNGTHSMIDDGYFYVVGFGVIFFLFFFSLNPSQFVFQ